MIYTSLIHKAIGFTTSDLELGLDKLLRLAK